MPTHIDTEGTMVLGEAILIRQTNSTPTSYNIAASNIFEKR